MIDKTQDFISCVSSYKGSNIGPSRAIFKKPKDADVILKDFITESNKIFISISSCVHLLLNNAVDYCILKLSSLNSLTKEERVQFNIQMTKLVKAIDHQLEDLFNYWTNELCSKLNEPNSSSSSSTNWFDLFSKENKNSLNHDTINILFDELLSSGVKNNTGTDLKLSDCMKFTKGILISLEGYFSKLSLLVMKIEMVKTERENQFHRFKNHVKKMKEDCFNETKIPLKDANDVANQEASGVIPYLKHKPNVQGILDDYKKSEVIPHYGDQGGGYQHETIPQHANLEQIQQLEIENAAMVTNYQSEELLAVQEATSHVETISELQSVLGQHIDMQSHIVETLYEDAVEAFDHISRGYDFLKKAQSDPDGIYKMASFILIVLAIILLFLDWYD